VRTHYQLESTKWLSYMSLCCWC